MTVLHIYIRSTGRENAKPRPPFFDKTACLASLIDAAKRVDSRMTFINDGPIPPDRLEMMQDAGRVIGDGFVDNRHSLRETLRRAARREYDHSEDLIWLAEDDYLYTPRAFEHLEDAARRMPEADYFSLYMGDPELRSKEHPPPRDRDEPEWVRQRSSTSTFGMRAQLLREDVRILRLMPWTGGAFDLTTCLTLEGRYPFTREELGHDLTPWGEPPNVWPRRMARGVLRTVLGIRGPLRSRSRRRRLYGPTRDLSTHVEIDCYDPSDHEFWSSLSEGGGSRL